jgi:predicted RNA-binding Zn-ribbon protein involved in translation (DUF1610 family)
MSGFACPYCGMMMSVDHNTYQVKHPSFERENGEIRTSNGITYYDSALEVEFYKCPNCEEYSVFAKGKGKNVSDVNLRVRPQSDAKKYPTYIPKQIREDYEEACAILFLSPKASATLSRRCLQGMIRDYWGIVKPRLYDEISALKDKIQPDLWSASDGLRQIGNIGAHMEKDVALIVDIDSGEAEKLICLIELLIKEWYINREERRKLFEDILQINEEKKIERENNS